MFYYVYRTKDKVWFYRTALHSKFNPFFFCSIYNSAHRGMPVTSTWGGAPGRFSLAWCYGGNQDQMCFLKILEYVVFVCVVGPGHYGPGGQAQVG